MTAGTYKRRNYFINKKFQLKYTLSIVMTLLIVMFVTGLGLYMGLWGSIIENFSDFRVSQNLENVRRIADYETARFRKGDYRLERIFREAEILSVQDKETLKRALVSVNRSLVPKVLLLALAILIGGIFLSHKIAGPMYRIERSAEAIHKGDLTVNFNTRKGDEIKDTTSALEGMVESLHDDIKRMKAAAINLDERILIAADRMNKEDADKLKAIVKEIDEILSKYKT